MSEAPERLAMENPCPQNNGVHVLRIGHISSNLPSDPYRHGISVSCGYCSARIVVSEDDLIYSIIADAVLEGKLHSRPQFVGAEEWENKRLQELM